MRLSRTMILALLALVLLVAAGCDDDSGPGPTLDQLWPHADGSSWTYDLEYTVYRTDSMEMGEELPDMADLRADLFKPVEGDPEESVIAPYTLAFDGMMTTGSGVVAQKLVEIWEPRPDSKSAPEWGRAQRLLRIRDLVRDGATNKSAALADSFARVFASAPTLFLGGGAYAYEDSGYYGYGDLYADHSWVYLEGHPRKGRTFSLQLVRGLADDLWLQGEIWRIGNVRVGGRNYWNAVECMYLVDFGLSPLVDEDGEVTGQARSLVYGHVFYVPELGPVGLRERSRMLFRTAYDPEGTGEQMVIDMEAWLLEADLAEE